MSAPVDVLAVMEQAAYELWEEVEPPHAAPDLTEARAAVGELVECFDAMLARWWSNATDADRRLANRAANARMKFAGKSHPAEPPIDESLGERRRETADRARSQP